MGRANLVLGLIVAGVGAWALAKALDLTMFSASHVPGPGLFPALVSAALLGLGVLLAAISVGQLVRARRHGAAVASNGAVPSDGEEAESHESLEDTSPRRLLRAGGVFVLYVAAMPLLTVLGFVPATAILVFALLFGIEGRRNWRALLVAILIPVACNVIFVQLLTIRLPTGLISNGPLGI